MKKNLVVMVVVAFSMALAVVSVQARWDTDPANDPVYKQFLEDTADIRKDIAMDRAELNALMANENRDPEKERDLSASISDNEQKLLKLARLNGSGGSGDQRYGCGGPRTAQGSCSSCAQVVIAGVVVSSGSGTCGSPGCPGAGVGQ